MNESKNKCSLKEHSEIDAVVYCQECKIFMCNKCEKTHPEICKFHHIFKLDKNIKEIFTGFCKEKNHINELNYFCKTHNKLCCLGCIAKIKDEYNGHHHDCDICLLKDIENEKRNNLKENIKNLENLSNTFKDSLNELKKIYEEMNENKEKLKLKIQKIFTKIRNNLNEREDELLLEVDKNYDKLYFNEDIIKEGETIPNKMKELLERGKIIDKEWNKDKLNLLINDCINIEDIVKNINIINENNKKCKLKNKEIKFNPEDENGIKIQNNFGYF